MRLALILPFFLLACTDKSSEGDDSQADVEDSADPGSDDECSSEDADGDGLDGCAEEALGTDPTSDDTDGDGLSDSAEKDCVSDPLDADETCYACGWPHNDPGTLSATGASVGDTIENLDLIDQCEEMVQLWDMAEEYHILFITAEW